MQTCLITSGKIFVAEYGIYTLLTFSTARTRAVVDVGREQTLAVEHCLHEKQASETARLRETGRECCAGLSVFRHQTPERIYKFKYEGKLHHRLGLLFCRPVALRGHA